MRAEIVCVGTELLLGDIVNTNAQYLSKQLASLGVEVYHQSVVGDNEGRLRETLQTAIGRSDMVITIGGLGPTKDDLTKESICSLFDLSMELHEPSMEKIKERYEKIGQEMTENNIKQAMVPAGCEVFFNNHGAAPGGVATNGDKKVVFLPGPPSEFCPMVDEYVVPYLQALSGKVFYSTTLREFGIGESVLETKLEDILDGSNPTAALYAKDGEVEIRITASAQDKETAKQMADKVVDAICSRVGEFIYGRDVSSYAEAVVNMLKDSGEKIATAESCTGGMMAEQITAIAGASQMFDLGASTYAASAKQRLLGISKKYFKKYGAVSEPVAGHMAIGIQNRAKSSFGVGITGVAGPDPDGDKPVGLVYVSVAYGANVYIKECHLDTGRTNREHIRKVAYLHAFDMVRRIKNGLPLTGVVTHTVKKFTKAERAAKVLDGVRSAAFFLALCVFVSSFTLVAQYYYDSYQNKQQNLQLNDYYDTVPSDELDIEMPEGYLDSFKILYSINDDIAGWIKIPGTDVDYPIVQALDNDEYLRQSFYGEYSKYGTLFFDYRNDIRAAGENMIIYGHNMKDKQMFGSILQYEKKAFWEAHPTLQLDTVYDSAEYEIFAFFECNTNYALGDVFDYYNRLTFANKEAFDGFVSQVRSMSFYKTDVDVEFGDTLVTLSTCGYDYTGHRYVLIARRASDYRVNDPSENAAYTEQQVQRKLVNTSTVFDFSADNFNLPTPLDHILSRSEMEVGKEVEFVPPVVDNDPDTDSSNSASENSSAADSSAQSSKPESSKPTSSSASSSKPTTSSKPSGSSSGSSTSSKPSSSSSASSSKPSSSESSSSGSSSTAPGTPSTPSVPSTPSTPSTPTLPTDITGVSIMGEPYLTANQLASYVLRYEKNPKLTGGTTILQLAQMYLEEGRAEGVRGDIAFIQAIIETGWFRFKGQVPYQNNNYCGLGAIDNTNLSESYESPRIGVRAHIQHLKAYGSTAPLNRACVDNRFKYVKRGSALTWNALGGKWASDKSYGSKINAKFVGCCEYNDLY